MALKKVAAAVLSVGSFTNALAVKLGAKQPDDPAERLQASSFLPEGATRDGVEPWFHIVVVPPDGGLGNAERKRNFAGLQDRIRLSTMPRRAHRDLPIWAHGSHGFFSGAERIVDSLVQDLPKDLNLNQCSLVIHGGNGALKSNWHLETEAPGSVWLMLFGEEYTGEDVWNAFKVQDNFGPQDTLIMLGNMWNETVEDYKDARVTSLWVPFLSTSFIGRYDNTPMDLVNRDFRPGPRPQTIAYQSSMCRAARETVWDSLNMELSQRGAKLGRHMAKCGGKRNLTELSNLTSKSMHVDDMTVKKYSAFTAAWVAEHNENNVGYMTEKIVNAFLAGAVPVYSGPSQISKVFDPTAYVHVQFPSDLDHFEKVYETDERTLNSTRDSKLAIDALLDPSKLKRLQHSTTPVITDEFMRRFFTWHPATWPKYGDGLRRKILEDALERCKRAAVENKAR